MASSSRFEFMDLGMTFLPDEDDSFSFGSESFSFGSESAIFLESSFESYSSIF